MITLIWNLAFYNAYIEFGIYLTVFKRSHTMVILKPNKPDYLRTKVYCLFVLLNCVGKLLEKMIAHVF